MDDYSRKFGKLKEILKVLIVFKISILVVQKKYLYKNYFESEEVKILRGKPGRIF